MDRAALIPMLLQWPMATWLAAVAVSILAAASAVWAGKES